MEKLHGDPLFAASLSKNVHLAQDFASSRINNWTINMQNSEHQIENVDNVTDFKHAENT